MGQTENEKPKIKNGGSQICRLRQTEVAESGYSRKSEAVRMHIKLIIWPILWLRVPQASKLGQKGDWTNFCIRPTRFLFADCDKDNTVAEGPCCANVSPETGYPGFRTGFPSTQKPRDKQLKTFAICGNSTLNPFGRQVRITSSCSMGLWYFHRVYREQIRAKKKNVFINLCDRY